MNDQAPPGVLLPSRAVRRRAALLEQPDRVPRWRQVRWTLHENVYGAFRALHTVFEKEVPSEEDFARLVLAAGIDVMQQTLREEREKAQQAEAPTSEQMVRML